MTLGMERVHGGRIIVTLDGSAMDGKSGKIMMTLASCFSQVEGNWKKNQPFSCFRKRSGPTRDSFLFLLGMMNDESLSLS